MSNMALQYSTLLVGILNKPPVLSLSGTDQKYYRRFLSDPVYISHSTLSLSDPDSLGIHNATLSLSPLLDTGLETLRATHSAPGVVSLPIVAQELGVDIQFGSSLSGELHAHITHSLYVNESTAGLVGDVDVVVYIDHSWLGDITLELEHAGIRRTLVTQPGGALCSADNLFHVVFDQEAEGSLGKTSSSPGVCSFRSQGVYRPEESLTAFSGVDTNGQWTLHVIDNVPATHNGILVGWAVIIQPEEDIFVSASHATIPPLLLTRILSPYQSISLNINSPGRITSLMPRIQISQPFERGLLYLPQLVLTHPDGTQVQLSHETYLPCVSGNYTYLVFSDQATLTTLSQCIIPGNSSTAPGLNITDSKYTLIDLLRPATSLSSLVGRQSGGEWLLTAWVSRASRLHLIGWSMYMATEPNIDTSYNALTGLLTLTGFDSADNYENVIRSIQYNNTAPSPTFWILRTVQALVFDGQTNSAATKSSLTEIVLHHIIIDLDPNDVTTALHPGFSTRLIEHSSPTPIVDSGALLEDPYLSQGLYNLTFVLEGARDGTSELVSVSVPGFSGIGTESYVDSVRHQYVLTVYTTSLSPISLFQTILRSATYGNSAEEITGENRTVSVSIVEYSTGVPYPSLTATTHIELIHTNDAPILILNILSFSSGMITNLLSYTEGQGTLQLAELATLELYDNDNTHLQRITAVITNSKELMHERLVINGSLPYGINYTYTPDTFTLTLYGNASIECYKIAVSLVAYEHLPHGQPDTTPRLVSFTPYDGIRYGPTTYAYILFSSVNNAPILRVTETEDDFVTSFREEMAPISIVSSLASIFDIDNSTLEYIEIAIENPLDGSDEVLLVSPVTVTQVLSGSHVQTITYTPSLTYPNSDKTALVISGLNTSAEYELVLRTAKYYNLADEPQIETREIIIKISDGLETAVARTFVLIVLVNDSPRLAEGAAPYVVYINEDEIGMGFSLLETGYLFEDDDSGDSKGVGVVSVECYSGLWQVRGTMLNCDSSVSNSSVNGTRCVANWVDIPCNLTVANSLLIRFKNDTRLRFMPKLDFNGNASLTVVAWDGTNETADFVFKSAVSSSNIDPFSSEQTTLTVVVIPVNDAPVLLSTPLLLPSIKEDYSQSEGVPVYTLVTHANDVDTNDVYIGIAVIYVDNSNGVWQYKLSTNTSWYNISHATVEWATLLDPNSNIRFVPDLNFHGDSSFSFKAWDRSQGSVPGSSQSTVVSNPYSDQFSINSTTAALIIEPVNDSPILQGDMYIDTISEDMVASSNLGSRVDTVIRGHYSDIDSVSEYNTTQMGISVIWVDNKFGRWQYSCNTSGFSWSYFIGDIQYELTFPALPLPDKATLLLSHCRIRFLPDPYFNTQLDRSNQPRPLSHRPSVLIRGWDNTGPTRGRSGTYGNDASYAASSSTNEYSMTSQYISIDITSINNPPTLHLTNATVQTYFTVFTEDLSAVRITGGQVELVDIDHDELVSLNVSIVSGSSADFLPNSSYCLGVDSRRESIQFDLSYTDLEVISVSLCPYQIVISPKLSIPSISVHISQYARVLNTLLYSNDLEEPSPRVRVIGMVVSDGENSSESSYAYVSIDLVNDAPILDLNIHTADLHTTAVFVEGEGPLLLTNSSNLRLIDYDSINLTSAVISLIPSPDMLHEVLNATTSGTNIVASYNYTTATLKLDGIGNRDTYARVLASVTYNNTFANPGNPDETERQVMFVVSDGDKSSRLAVAYVSFFGINNHPYLDVNGDTRDLDYMTSFREEMGPVSVVSPNLSLIDIDNSTLAYISVRITNPLDGANEFLTVDNVTMRTIETNQLGIPKIVETTLFVADTTFSTVSHELVISGLDSVEEFRQVLLTLKYNNIKNEINTQPRILHFYANDGLLSSPLSRTNVTLERVNDSPYFISPSVLIFPNISEDTFDSSGISVMLLASGLINDSDSTDPQGIAVIATDVDKGIWQYRLNFSSNWINIISNVSLYNALLLTADADNYIRFVPITDFNGNVSISFLAWDASDGYIDGDRRSADSLQPNYTNAFSEDSRTLTLVIIPVNDAPVVLTPAEIDLASILEDDSSSFGISVPTLTALLDRDVDSSQFGIAIVAIDIVNREWQYTLNNGTNWLVVTADSELSSLVFRARSDMERVRFVPSLNYNGQSSFSYKLWDLTSSEVSGSSNVNTQTNPVTGPFSVNTATARVTVDPVNDSPVLSPGLFLSPIYENMDILSNQGIPVSTVIDQAFNDVDAGFKSGLAVVSVDHRNGEFEYSCGTSGNAVWKLFIGGIAYGQFVPRLPFPTKATLLSDICRIRFKPNTHFNTEKDLTGAPWTENVTPFLLVKGWDQTSGTVGEYGVDTTSSPDDSTNSFSADTVNITIEVKSVNLPPSLNLQTSDDSFQTAFAEPLPPLRIVRPSLLVDVDSVSITDSDHVHLHSLRVELENRVDGFSETLLYDLSMTNLNATVHDNESDSFMVEFASSDAQSPALLSYYVMLLKSLRYQNTNQEPTTSPNRTVSFLVIDPEFSSTSAHTTIYIQLVNDPPELHLDSTSASANLNTFVSYTEGQGEFMFLNSSRVSLIDYDSPYLQNATITLTNPRDVAFEILRATNTQNINVTYANHKLELIGPAPIAEFKTALLSLSYEHTNSSPGNPDTSMRLITFSVRDGSVSSVLASASIFFSSVNDAPILDLNGNPEGEDYTTTFYEQQGSIPIISPDLVLIDIDNTTLDRITVRIHQPTADDFLYVDNVTLYSDNPAIAKTVILTNLRSDQQFNISRGELVVSGLDYVHEYVTVLKTLRYDNSADETGNFVKILSVVANDGLSDSNEASIYINVTEVNDPPSINLSIPVIRTAIEEDIPDSTNIGVSVASIIAPIFNDVDAVSLPGIAITAADTSIGYWEYIVVASNFSNSSQSLIPPTAAWIRFPTPTSYQYVLPLRASGELIRVRFVPYQDMNGESSISFFAWDGSQLSSGEIVSLTNYNPRIAAFSAEEARMYIDITPVNDAPVIQTIPSLTISLQEDEVNSFGISVSELVTRVTDEDTHQQDFGLAVVMNDNSNGSWQYTITGGLAWYDINSTTPSSALLLRSVAHGGYRIRFVPERDFYGLRELSYVAWDLTSGGDPTTYASTIRSDPTTSPFSSAVATLILNIEPVNDSPYFDESLHHLATITEDTINLGTSVLDIVGNSFRDIDSTYQIGIAVTNVDTTDGKWEWQCDAQQDWQDFIGDIVFGVRTPYYPLPIRATLLSGECTIRFLPNLNFNTEKQYNTGLPRPSSDIPFISMLAWDNTGVTAGKSGYYGIDTTYHNASDTNEFSFYSSVATINVTSVNDPPVLVISGQGVVFSALFREDGGAVPIVEPAQLFITDADHDTLDSVAIVLERVYDTGYETISLSPNPGVVVGSGNEVFVNTSVNEVERLVFNAGEVGNTYRFKLLNPNPQERVSVAAYQTAIRTLVYNNYHSEPTNMTRFIRFYVDDGDDLNRIALTTLFIELIVENKPVLNLGISQVTFTEDFIGSLPIVSQNLTLTDVDHNEFFFIVSANIFFDQPPESVLEYISISNSSLHCNTTSYSGSRNSTQTNPCVSPIVSHYDPVQGRITLSGEASLDVYRDTLKTVVYTNRIQEPTDLEKIITFEVFDTNNLKSDPVSVKIYINLRNDQPPFLSAGNVFQYVEQQPAIAYPIVIGDNITYTDADSGGEMQYSVSVSITNPIDAPYEMLSASPASGITAEYHTTEVVYSTTQLVERCVNLTDNSTTSTPVSTDRNVSTSTNNSNLNGNTTGNVSSDVTPPPTPATVLRCENVTESVNRTNTTTVYTGLTLIGPASISEFLEALATLTYTNGAEEPSPTDRRVTFIATDTNLTSNLAEVTIRVLETNDIPVVDLNGFMIGTRFMVTYSEGSEAIPIVDSMSMSIYDDDHTHLVEATITLTTIYDLQKELLEVSTAGTSLLSNYNSTTGVLSVTGNASVEAYQLVLRTLTYVNLEGGPGAPNPHMREITVVVSDSVDNSLTAYSVVTFLAINDPPFLDLNGNLPGENATANFIEEGDQVRVFSSDAVIMDIDNGTLASLSISLVNPVDGASELIFIHPDVYALLSPMGSIQTTNHSIVLMNFLSINKYIMALQQIYYINTMDEPSYDTRSVVVVASDGILTNILSYVGTITIQPVNDLPQFSFNADPNSNATYDIEYREDSSSIPVINVVSPDFTLTDDDNPVLTRIIIERSPSPDGTYEKLFFLSSNPISGLGHTYPQCPNQGISNPLTLDITVSLTLQEWRTALSSLSYCNMDPNSFGGVRQINIVLVDGSGERSAARYSNINVIPINDPPKFLASPPSVTTDEDNSVQLQVLSNFTDYEETLTGAAIEIVSQPARGTAVVRQPSGIILYTPAPNDNGVVTFQFRGCDSEANCSLPITATVVITPVNDPPTPVGTGIIPVVEDESEQVNLLQYFTDVEDIPATNNTRVVLTPRGGSWEYNMAQEIFYYSPTQHRTGDDSLIFEACDNDRSCINITLTFKITPVNDLPFITINYPNSIIPLVISEDTAVNVSVFIEDVEDNDELDLQVLSVTNGVVRLFTLSTEPQPTNILLQRIFVEFRPNANFYGLANITFSATDNENGVSTKTIQIRVEYHNDAPTIEITVVTINEDTPLILTLPAGLGISDSESIITSQQIEFLTDPDTVMGSISYDSTTGVLSYTPPPNFNTESIQFSLRVCDTDTRDEIQCSTFVIIIMITAVNDAPTLSPFIFSMREDSTNTTNILPYLSDVEDGDVIPGRISVSAPDPASGVATYNLITGDVTYTPNANFFGTDFITLRVCDSVALCGTVRLEVYVIGVNDAPIADGLRHVSTEDTIDLINIGTIVRDVDTLDNSQNINLKISIVETVGSTTTLVDEGSTTEGGEIRVFQDEGVISYEPPTQFIGYDTFTFAVCDKCDESRNAELGRTTLEDIECLSQIEENDGSSINPTTGMSIACSIGTIVIVVVNKNDVPIVSDISAITPLNQLVSIEPFGTQTLFNDSSLFIYDEDDKQTAFAISQGFDLSELGLTSSSNVDTKVIRITSSPSGGRVLIAGSDRVYITYDPNANFIGYDEFQYELCDLAQIPTCGNAIARVFVSSPGPRIDTLVVTGSGDLSDSKVSRGDTIQLSFSEDTNQPPQQGKDNNGRFCGAQVDEVLTFDSPFINSTTFPNTYCAKWDNPSTLTVTIIARGYPEPDSKIGSWRVRVTQDPSRICNGFDSNHQRYDSNELNTNCLFNAGLTSSHSTSVSLPATGDWGTSLPRVATAIIQNLNVATGRPGAPAIQAETLIKLQLKEPFSSSQLKLYCEMDINEILNSLILFTGTEIELQSCSNLLSDGSNADQVYSETDASSLSSLGYPMLTELIFRVLELDVRLQGLDSNQLLSTFLEALRQAPIAQVVLDTLNVNIPVPPDAIVGQIGTVDPLTEHVDVNTPTVLSAVVSDPDNFDDVYSDFDVFRIIFSVDTNEPGVGSKDELDKIFVFTPSLGINYIGTWETSRILLIIIIDSSRPEINGTVPTIFNLRLEFLPNYLDNQTLVNSSSFTADRLHCIGDNVCAAPPTAITIGICDSTETSCRAKTPFSTFTGNFGTADGVSESPVGVIAGTSIAIIIVIIILGIIIVLLLIFYCYKRVQEKRDRDKALALVRSWKQKQKALSEQQKKPSMLAVDESWKSPPAMPLMRGNIDPFSTTAPKLSMESGAFISPTSYEPFQPRAYPSILDSSYPTTSSALPPILLRTVSTPTALYSSINLTLSIYF